MSGVGKFKLSDAIAKPNLKPAKTRHGKPALTSSAAAEQSREAQEVEEARDAEGSIRNKMVDIGRGNQQSGR